MRRIFPFLGWLPEAKKPSTLRADAIAGLTGAVIVLPQGVAYALIAGLPPQYGLYTAIITAIVASLFGSSRHLVSGPTAAISIVVLSVVSGVVPPDSPEFITYVLTLTVLTGLIQLALGVMRLGVLVNFISHTVVIGFTVGAAVLIATSQLRHLFGLTFPSGHSFIDTISSFARTVPETNLVVLSVGLVTLVSAILIRRFNRRWPYMLLAMIVGSVYCWLIDGVSHGVSMVGAMPSQLPPFSMPLLSFETLRELAPGAMAVAIIALIEAVSIARAVAIRSNQRIDGNQEFIGQGLSNIAGGFFSCYAGSGSFTRSGANYDAGARTPMSAIFAAVILVGILLWLPDVTLFLPMPAMAGIVLLIAWNLIDLEEVRGVFSVSYGETGILLVTFASTLLIALEFAIYFGVLLSLVLYLKLTARPPVVPLSLAWKGGEPVDPGGSVGPADGPVRGGGVVSERDASIKVLRVDGSLFFGAVDHIQLTLQQYTSQGYRHIVLAGQGVNFIDFAGAELLAREVERLRALGGDVYFCSFKARALFLLRKDRYRRLLTNDNFFDSTEQALKKISSYTSVHHEYKEDVDESAP